MQVCQSHTNRIVVRSLRQHASAPEPRFLCSFSGRYRPWA